MAPSRPPRSPTPYSSTRLRYAQQLQCTTPITGSSIWEDLEIPTRFSMTFLGRFWHLYVVDILKLNELKVSDFFFPNWKSERDLNLSGEALYAGLVWWEIKNYIRTYKYVHVRTVYLTQKSSVWTRTFLYLRFTRFSVYWSAPKLHNSKIRIECSGNATLEEAESHKET